MNFAGRWTLSLTILMLVAGCADNLAAQSTQQKAEQQQAEQQQAENQIQRDIEQPVMAESGKLFWIFLNSGKSTEGVDPDEVKKMQQEHLANFKRLAEENILLTAGPMTDPEKMLRGIVVVRARDQATLKELFKSDPFVQQGYLKIEAMKMKVEFGELKAKITPQGLEEYRIVVIERNTEDSGSSEIQNDDGGKTISGTELVSNLSQDSEVLLGVSLDSNGNDKSKTAVLILTKPEDDHSITDKMQGIAEIKTGQLRTRVFPLYMGKGTLKPRVPAS